MIITHKRKFGSYNFLTIISLYIFQKYVKNTFVVKIVNKKTFKILSVSILVIMATLTLIFKKPNTLKAEEDIYTLKSYKNTVALYKNDEILEIYSDIVLNTLPETDIFLLSKGIVIENYSEINRILEDYDS